MAIDPQIEKIVRDQVAIFNLDETRSSKATAEIKPSSERGHGNSDAGRHCVYDVSIVRHLLPERVLRVWHLDGKSSFPESTTIYIYPRSGERREESVVSAEHLAERLSAIFAAEEWDER
jgi:hypothetical protein